MLARRLLHCVTVATVANALHLGVSAPRLQAGCVTRAEKGMAGSRGRCVRPAWGLAAPALARYCEPSPRAGARRRIHGALAERMQLMDGGGMGRREMVSLAASCVAGWVLCGPQTARAEQAGAPAWLPVYGKNGQLQYLGFAQAENTYPVRFIEYLSRLLLNYDEASRGVFKSNVEPMEVLPKAQRQKAMFDEFVRFSTSVEYGLQQYNGTKGPAKLARRLSFRFRDNPDALQQVHIRKKS